MKYYFYKQVTNIKLLFTNQSKQLNRECQVYDFNLSLSQNKFQNNFKWYTHVEEEVYKYLRLSGIYKPTKIALNSFSDIIQSKISNDVVANIKTWIDGKRTKSITCKDNW